MLKSAKLTGLWENKLRKIERHEYDPAGFIDELKEMVNKIVLDVLRDNSNNNIAVETEEAKPKKTRKKSDSTKKKTTTQKAEAPKPIVCPACGKGNIIKGKKAYGCSAYADGCRFIIPFEECPGDASHDDLANYINSKFSK